MHYNSFLNIWVGRRYALIMPEVFVKAVLRGNLQKVSDLTVNARAKRIVGCALRFKILKNLSELREDGILCTLSVNYKLGYFAIHISLHSAACGGKNINQ